MFDKKTQKIAFVQLSLNYVPTIIPERELSTNPKASGPLKLRTQGPLSITLSQDTQKQRGGPGNQVMEHLMNIGVQFLTLDLCYLINYSGMPAYYFQLQLIGFFTFISAHGGMDKGSCIQPTALVVTRMYPPESGGHLLVKKKKNLASTIIHNKPIYNKYVSLDSAD